MRMSAQSDMVSDVPPPPLAVSSCCSRAETAGYVSLAGQLSRGHDVERGLTADGFDDTSEHG